MAKQTQTSTAPNENKNMGSLGGDPDFSTWTERQIGFAPYWKPKTGESAFASLVARDDSGEWTRLQLVAHRDLMCRRGPGNDDETEGATGEEVLVKKGETFSISVYYSLEEEFAYHLYLAGKLGRAIPMLLTATKKTKTGSGNQVWNWKLQVSPEDNSLLMKHQVEYKQLQAGGVSARPALEN